MLRHLYGFLEEAEESKITITSDADGWIIAHVQGTLQSKQVSAQSSGRTFMGALYNVAELLYDIYLVSMGAR